MSEYRGDIKLGDTIDLKFTTRKFSTGVPFALAGTPVISAYVGNSTTQITTGVTLTVDFDSVTGLNNVRVVASTGNGFALGNNVDLVITAGTVDGVSVVGEVIGSFSIEARSPFDQLRANHATASTFGEVETATSIADGLLDRAAGIETGYTMRQGLRQILAACAGLVSGGGTTTVTVTNPAGTKNRMVATVDASGNRSAITPDLT